MIKLAMCGDHATDDLGLVYCLDGIMTKVLGHPDANH